MKFKQSKSYTLILGLILLCTLFVTGCEPKEESRNRPLVYASFYPVYSLVDAIGEDHIDLRSFMPINATIHDWEPSLKAMKELEKADLLIVNGANMERWVPKVAAALPNLKIVSLSDKADLISYTGAAAIGDFQIMSEYEMEEKIYPMIFGHTHEEYMRLAFFKDDGSLTEQELIHKGRELMEDTGQIVHQKETVDVKNGQVYRLEMGHNSGEVDFKMPSKGKWIFYSDRVSEEILSYELTKDGENPLDGKVRLKGSSQGVDQVTYDPHSWLSVKNAKIYLNTITQALTELDPEHERDYSKNRFQMVDKLTILEQEYQKKFDALEDVNKNFIVIHYAFEYLAREFGLRQYPLQGLASMDDPSIRSVIRSIDYAKELGIDTVFYEYGHPTAVAESISEEIENGKIMPLASMEYPIVGRPKEETGYYELLKMNLENLYRSLSR